jgi:hypothetical protein
LKNYFKNKSDLIKLKIDKIDKELNFDDKINETLNVWISLPTDIKSISINDFDLIDNIINDIYY